jgi:hypothetical protein
MNESTDPRDVDEGKSADADSQATEPRDRLGRHADQRAAGEANPGEDPPGSGRSFLLGLAWWP